MEKILVSYFSATGSTKRLAENIADVLNADIFEIEPEVKYTKEDLKWPDKSNRSFMEMKDKNFRPLVSKKLTNSEEYDKVLLGFPIWYYTAPTIVNTFIEENDLTGKDVYVFATSGATPVDKSFKDLKKSYPNINFISGKRLNGTFNKNEIINWIK